MQSFLKKHWPLIFISTILIVITYLNFHSGKLIMGNDNFSPELDPKLTISRSFLNPAWRDNRVLGIPSDSEQADVWRTILFWLGEQFLPTWLISQGYLFLTLFIGVISAGKVVKYFSHNSQIAEFFGSLLYLFSAITVWIYFYPIHLFTSAYAFIPLIIWRIIATINNPSRTNKLLILFSSLLAGTTALTATMFITSSITIGLVTLSISTRSKPTFKNWLTSIFIYLLPHLFWILPFTTYVISNNQALQNSSINKEITASTLASEESNNTWDKTLRFSTPWIDSRENDQDYTYRSREWFRENPVGINLAYLPILFTTIALLIALVKPKKYFSQIIIGITGLLGFLLLNGFNPPFGNLYSLLDQYIPLFHQVFRWGSSKFWPLLLYPLIILASFAISHIIHWSRFRFAQATLFLLLTSIIIYSAHPILTYQLIRDEVFVNIPNEYHELKHNISDTSTLIDTTPHTNTRYFRKYDWGFWGSVFLNYYLDNPTTEKALIIGSNENQTAYNTITQAYNSQDPHTYHSSLSRYNIAQVLSDRSVTHQGLGLSYGPPFDWTLHDEVIANNPDLTKLWSDNYLTLYQSNLPTPVNANPVAPYHNYATLNKLLAARHTTNPYITNSTGAIYPLAIEPKSIENNLLTLNTNTNLTTPSQYSLNINHDALSSLPILFSYADNTISASPYFPTLSLNQQPIYQLPQSQIITTAQAVTVNNQRLFNIPTVFSPDKQININLWSTIATQDLLNQLGLKQPIPCNADTSPHGSSHFDLASNTFHLTTNEQSCFATDFNTDSHSLITTHTTLQSNTPILVDICLHSYLQDRCLNTPTRHLVTTTPQTVPTHSLYTTDPHDNIVIYFNAIPYLGITTDLQITSLTLDTLAQPHPITFPSLSYQNIEKSFTVQTGDTLTTSYPITSLIPTLMPFQHYCDQRGSDNNLTSTTNQLTFTTANCIDGAYSGFSLPDFLHARALLTYVNSHYQQGIPLDFSLRRNDQYSKLTREYLSTYDDPLYNFTLLPIKSHDFTLELNNISIGTKPSINTILDYVSIPIPRQWLDLQLSPLSQQSSPFLTITPYLLGKNTGTYLSLIQEDHQIYTLPTATSPYWQATILPSRPNNIISLYWQVLIGQPITTTTIINGWQPAWEVPSPQPNQYIGVIFLPNILAYLGLIFGLGTAILLVTRKR